MLAYQLPPPYCRHHNEPARSCGAGTANVLRHAQRCPRCGGGGWAQPTSSPRPFPCVFPRSTNTHQPADMPLGLGRLLKNLGGKASEQNGELHPGNTVGSGRFTVTKRLGAGQFATVSPRSYAVGRARFLWLRRNAPDHAADAYAWALMLGQSRPPAFTSGTAAAGAAAATRWGAAP